MTRRFAFIRRLRKHERGAAIIELAFTAPLFLLLLMGIFDYSWQLYAKQVLQGAVSKAGRDSTLESNMDDQADLDNKVRTAVLNIFPSAEVRFIRQTYDSFDEVGKPEPFDDANGDEIWQSTECFEDVNGNGTWDSDRGRSGNGGAEDIILFTAEMDVKRVLPVWSMLGQLQMTTLSESTVLRNQPFGSNADASPTRCPS